MPTPISIPNYAPVLLQPTLPHSPDLKLLRHLADKESNSKETYSVTFSPVFCPVDKRHLYSLKPYFWEIKAATWDCDLPQGQKQLEKMAQAVHILSLATVDLADHKELYKTRLETLLRCFFVEDETRMIPQVEYAQCDPSVTPLKGSLHFNIAIRFLLLVTQSLLLIAIDPDLDGHIRQWFSVHVLWMETSELGKAARKYGNDGRGNNVAAWYHATLLSHLAYIDPETSIKRATVYFADHAQAFSPAEYFAGELVRTRPRHYTLFMLEPTLIIASLTAPRGTPPCQNALQALSGLLEFARSVKCGEIELEVDNDLRYGAKLAWFEKVWRSWKGDTRTLELDGSGWQGGWNQYTRLLWSGL